MLSLCYLFFTYSQPEVLTKGNKASYTLLYFALSVKHSIEVKIWNFGSVRYSNPLLFLKNELKITAIYIYIYIERERERERERVSE